MKAALQAIRALAPQARPRIAVLLGSGWGGFSARVEAAVRIRYADLPGFAPAGVAGHVGELWLGRVGPAEVAVLGGRRHAYEGGEADGMKTALAALHALGCGALVQTNAAGSLRADMPPGSLMLVADHLNLPQRSPLVGESGDARFVAMADAYDPGLRALAHRAAADAGVTLHEGVYAWALGPQFETPAEIRMLRTLGCDTVGMSMVPENIVARHCGLRCVGVSAITNYAVGLTEHRVTHDQNLVEAARAAEKLTPLLKRFLADL